MIIRDTVIVWLGTGGATLMMVTVPMVHGLASMLQRGLTTNKVGSGFIYSCTGGLPSCAEYWRIFPISIRDPLVTHVFYVG